LRNPQIAQISQNRGKQVPANDKPSAHQRRIPSGNASRITTLICLFFLTALILFSLARPLGAASLQDEEHEHSDMINLYTREFQNELWRLPDPHRLIYSRFRWVLGAAILIFILLAAADRREKRRGDG
jgi:hypothetical protein